MKIDTDYCVNALRITYNGQIFTFMGEEEDFDTNYLNEVLSDIACALVEEQANIY